MPRVAREGPGGGGLQALSRAFGGAEERGFTWILMDFEVFVTEIQG